MALVIYWYGIICFAIVGCAIFGALWVLFAREGAGRGKGWEGKSKYESLLRSRPDGIGFVGSDQLWRSCWRWMHPVWLLGQRGTSGIVMLGLLCWDIQMYDASIFVYYTEWTFALVIVYFVIGTVISAHGCWMYSKRNIETEEMGAFLKADLEESSTNITFRTNNFGTNKVQTLHEREGDERRAGFWGYLMQTVYQTCAGAVVLTDIVFWCVIVPFLTTESFSLNLVMGSMHILNAVFLLLDTAVNSLPFPWFRFAYFILWSCLYVIFQWVLHACGFTWWPYPFLELSTPWAPLWYFSLALVHIPCYGLYALIAKAKHLIFPKLFPQAYVGPY